MAPTHHGTVKTLETARLKTVRPHWSGLPGQPSAERAALARALVAKAVLNLPNTAALIEKTFVDQLVGRTPRDSRAIETSQKVIKAEKQDATGPYTACRHGRTLAHRHRMSLRRLCSARKFPPQQREERPKEPTRRERQPKMRLGEMRDDLPKHCAIGTKRNVKGQKDSWIGYKLHLDVADGGVPFTAILTSASLHVDQVAIPLATATAAVVKNPYDLMVADSDATTPRLTVNSWGTSQSSRPILAPDPRGRGGMEEAKQEQKRQRCVGHLMAEYICFNELGMIDRVNGRLKEGGGGRPVRVRSNEKLLCDRMFGLLALKVDQLLRFVT